MKTLILMAALLITVPSLTAAQTRIPDTELRAQNESCLAKCSETRSYAFCAETCACIAGEMSRHWTAEDFRTRTDKLSKHAEDRSVHEEMDRMASYCAKRGRQSARQ